MKKLILLLAGGLAWISAFSQGGPYFGIKGGIGLSPLGNDVWWNDTKVTYQPSLSWAVGPSIGYNAVYYNYGVTIGGFYKTYSSKFKIARGPKTNVKYERASYNLGYLDVPIMIRFRPKGDTRTRTITYGGPYFEIGVQPSMLLSVQHRHTDTLDQSILTDIDKSNFEKYDIAAMMGFGFHQIGTAKWALTHGFRFSYAFLDIVNQDNKIDLLGLNNGEYGATKLLSVSYILTIYYKIPKKR